MQRTKNIAVLWCYESDCGGETAATEAIGRAVSEYECVTRITRALPPLVHTDSFRFFSWMILSVCRWLVFIVMCHRLDWVYTTTYTAGVAAVLLRPFLGYRIAWHMHGTRIPPPPAGLRGMRRLTQATKRAAVVRLHRFFLKHADDIIIPSARARRRLGSIGASISHHRITIVPNGVDCRRFRPLSIAARNRIRRKHGIADDTQVLLYAGRLEKRKGLEKLLEAMRVLSATNDVRLFIVYPAPATEAEKDEQQRLLLHQQTYQLKQMITWVEDPRNIEAYYHLADLTVSFSRFEVSPLSALESFASGTLFCGFPAGDLKSTLSAVDGRLLLPIHMSALCRRLKLLLHLSARERQVMIRKGLSVARSSTWENAGRRICRVMAFQA